MNKPDWNIGYTTRNHLCIDLDNASYYKVRSLVNLLMCSYPEIGDCIIMQSSTVNQIERWIYPVQQQPRKQVKRDNYHVIFNNFLLYETCCRIIETLAFLGVLNEEYIRIREMRNDMTLRVSKTVCVEYTKPKPVFIEYIQNRKSNNRGQGIYLYNKLRKNI